MRAMKYANGNASTASVTVTAAAIPIVRSAIVRYVGSLKIVRKLSSVQSCTSLPVNESTLQNAEMNSDRERGEVDDEHRSRGAGAAGDRPQPRPPPERRREAAAGRHVGRPAPRYACVNVTSP